MNLLKRLFAKKKDQKKQKREESDFLSYITDVVYDLNDGHFYGVVYHNLKEVHKGRIDGLP